jgi:hypothetical protein
MRERRETQWKKCNWVKDLVIGIKEGKIRGNEIAMMADITTVV